MTSSTAGKLGAPRSASYSGSKHALHVSAGICAVADTSDTIYHLCPKWTLLLLREL